ncbi:Octanoyltransferase [Buchnera aphidicola (Neophyllaphis podocarpi)]|uniref:lipoyl(octanoyl) transferase LipB n=1 Tax=Buchnera aphidicola TaxID=9 RepID=UPI0034639B21
MKNKIVIVRDWKLSYWSLLSDSMYIFTKKRNSKTFDEIWLAEHYPVFTIGKSGNKNDIFHKSSIPIMYSNRGGKVTYHGPGQLLVYFLFNLKRLNISIKQLVYLIELSIIKTLDYFNIKSKIKNNHPGVFVNEYKICFLGLKIIQGCSLHGISLNINMDLKPFSYIIPCGNKNIRVTQMTNFISPINNLLIKKILLRKICKLFLFNKIIFSSPNLY